MSGKTKTGGRRTRQSTPTNGEMEHGGDEDPRYEQRQEEMWRSTFFHHIGEYDRSRRLSHMHGVIAAVALVKVKTWLKEPDLTLNQTIQGNMEWSDEVAREFTGIADEIFRLLDEPDRASG